MAVEPVTQTAWGAIDRLGTSPANEGMLTRQTARATKVWVEDRIVAHHDGRTYDVVVSLPMGQTTPPLEFNEVVHRFQWL